MLKEERLKLLTLKKEGHILNLPIKYKQKNTSSGRTTSDTNKTIPTIQNKLFYSVIQQSLWIKYNVSPKQRDMIELEDIVQSKYCRTIAVFKEKLLYNYQEEFLKRYYTKRECKDRIPKFVAYYKNYLTFFCNPTFAELMINDLIQVYGERQAKVYYSLHFKDNTNEKEHSSQYASGKRKKDKETNKKENNTIFNSTIKCNISMNSQTTLLLNQCDTNEINTKPLIQNPSNFINMSSIEAMNDIMKELSPSEMLMLKKSNILSEKKLPMKKLFLMKKNIKKMVTIDKSKSTKKKSINKQRVVSPLLKPCRYDDYICYTEGNKKIKDKQSLISRNIPYAKGVSLKTHKYNYAQTEINFNFKKPLINKVKLFNQVKLKISHKTNTNTNSHTNTNTKTNTNINRNHLINHNKNVLSHPLNNPITERIKQTNKFAINKIEHKDVSKSKVKPTLKIDTKDVKISTVCSVSKTSRNIKSSFDKCFHTIQNDSLKVPNVKRELNVKFPLFKTLNIKDFKDLKDMNTPKIRYSSKKPVKKV